VRRGHAGLRRRDLELHRLHGHAQCKDSACQLETGACFSTVLHVDRGSPCDGADGSIDLPFCEINDAVTKVGADEPTAILVKPNTMPYSEQVQVPSGRTLAIVATATAWPSSRSARSTR
jgi:hypothetical protein